MHYCRCVFLDYKAIGVLLLCAHLIQKFLTDEFESKKVTGSKKFFIQKRIQGKENHIFLSV